MPSPAADLALALIPLDKIDRSPTNPRKTYDGDALKDLAASIAKEGVLEPALVRPRPGGRYELVFGERRWRASKLAKAHVLPCMVRELSDHQVIEKQVVENNQREDLQPLEEAAGFALLLKHGDTVEEVAAKIGRPKSYVFARLKLGELGKPVKQALVDGKIGLVVAGYLAALWTPQLQEDALRRILEEEKNFGGPITTAEVRALLKREYTLRLAEAPFDRDDPALVAGVPACNDCERRSGKAKQTQLPIYEQLESPDICTDPPCFRRKKDAAAERKIEEAKAKGLEVLTGKAAEKALLYGSDYVEPDDRCDGDPKGRTYKKLLGRKAPAPALAVTDQGVREVLPKAAVAEALKAAGHDFKAPRASSSSSGSSSSVDAARRREAEKLKLKNAVSRAALERIASKASTWASGELGLWRLLAHGFLEGSWHDVLTDAAKRRGVDLKGTRAEDVFKKQIPEMDHHELQAFVVECIASKGLFFAHAVGRPKAFTEACKLFGVDLKRVEAEVKREQVKAQPRRGAHAKTAASASHPED